MHTESTNWILKLYLHLDQDHQIKDDHIAAAAPHEQVCAKVTDKQQVDICCSK